VTSAELSHGRRPPPVAPPAGSLDIDIGDFAKVVVSRWKLLPLFLALALGLAGAYIVLTPALYAATMAFLVDTRERPPIGSDAAPIAQNPDAALVESQMRILQSSTVLRRVVEMEHLRDDPEFNGGGPGGLLSNLKKLVGLDAARAAGPITDAQIFGALLHAITVKRSDKSYVIDVEVRASQPEKAERLAHALAKAYFDSQEELGGDVSAKETKWLDAKIAELRNRLQEAEARVQEYRKKNAIVISEGLTPAEQQLKTADAALVAARNKRDEAEARYAEAVAAARGGSAETVRSPLLERLRGEYAALAREAALTQSTLGPRHPSYIAMQSQLAAQRAQMERELANISASLRRDLDATREVERSAEAQVTKLKQAINANGDKRLELVELERRAESLRDNYQKALGTRESSRREIVSSPNPVLINDPVAQAGKVSPKATPALLIATAGGVNLWIAASLLLEFLARRRGGAGVPAPASTTPLERKGDARADDGAKSRADVVALPILGLDGAPPGDGSLEKHGSALKRVNRAMDRIGHPYRDAAERLLEQLRANARAPQETPIVAIDAGGAKSGASTLALALARAACDQGDRVLILDYNLDHPTFAGLIPHLSEKGAPREDAGPFRACRKDASSGGAIFLGDDAHDRLLLNRRSLGKRLDLILLDCGAERIFPERVEREIDADILVERAGSSERRRAVLSFPRALRRPTQKARGGAQPRRFESFIRKLTRMR
jgi:uncharacterized protein involved in exopolysaccharide biosynthesis